VLCGTGMTAVHAEAGEFRSESDVRKAIASIGRRRPIYWTHICVRE
jgi:hypothetical protein